MMQLAALKKDYKHFPYQCKHNSDPLIACYHENKFSCPDIEQVEKFIAYVAAHEIDFLIDNFFATSHEARVMKGQRDAASTRAGDGRGEGWRRGQWHAGAAPRRRPRAAAELGGVDARGVRVAPAQEGARRRRPGEALPRRLHPLQGPPRRFLLQPSSSLSSSSHYYFLSRRRFCFFPFLFSICTWRSAGVLVPL